MIHAGEKYASTRTQATLEVLEVYPAVSLAKCRETDQESGATRELNVAYRALLGSGYRIING